MAEIKIYAKPQYLHRYRPLGDKCDRELEALLKGYIYCPSISSMNDPMEGAHRKSFHFQESELNETRTQKLKQALDTIGIASMSEVHDHEPMWAHYAGQFSGMCVRYRLSNLLKGMAKDISFTRMMYSEKEPVLLNTPSNSFNRARLCLSSKTVRWASEREWRIFRPEIGKATYGKEMPILRIYLGSRVSLEDQAKVLEVASKLNVPVEKMSINAYSIEFEKVAKRKILEKKAK